MMKGKEYEKRKDAMKEVEAHPVAIEFAKELKKHRRVNFNDGSAHYEVPAYIIDAYANAKPKQ